LSDFGVSFILKADISTDHYYRQQRREEQISKIVTQATVLGGIVTLR